MSEQAIRTRIGLFVVFALLLLGALIVMFSSMPAFFSRGNRYTLILDNAAGVGVGTPVRRSGVKIGEVRGIELDDETGKVRAEIEVPTKYTLRKHEVPLLSRTGGLLGDLAIDFVPQTANGKELDRTPVEPGSEMKAVPEIDISASLAQLNRAADSFNKMSPTVEEAVRELGALAKLSKSAVPEIEIAARNWASVGERTNILLRTNEEKLVKTLDNINETFARASQVLNDENQRNLSATLKNVRGASENLNDLTKSTDEVMKEGRQTLKQVNGSLVKVDQVMTNLERVTKPLADRSESLSRNLDESTDRLN
ncbi:MAG: MCE family protein, partial [Planctomycetia bacterium]|nr:MCE family protein [Planctomycetia bacterium]